MEGVIWESGVGVTARGWERRVGTKFCPVFVLQVRIHALWDASLLFFDILSGLGPCLW